MENLNKESIIVFSSPLLSTRGGWKGKYLFVAKYGDIFLPVFNDFDMMRWQIDRPMTLVWDAQIYGAGEWLKLVRGEQGQMWAIPMIAQLQIEAQIFYHDIVIAQIKEANGERGVRHLVQEGGSDGAWREAVPPGGNS